MTTAVTYHTDRYSPARPAINVKCHVAGVNFWPEGWSHAAPFSFDRGMLVELSYSRVVSTFWQNAQKLATQLELGHVEQEGRSGGWLVLADPRDPSDPCEDYEAWLEGYSSLSAWCEVFIVAAPDRVAAAAQQLALDLLGEGPAYRMFGGRYSEGQKPRASDPS